MMSPEMEKIWYAVIENKADGPHSANEIQEMLNLGKLNFTDFVFKPGLTAWTPISEFKEFERRNQDKEVTKLTEEHEIPKENNQEGWILLVKHINSVGQKNLVQSGPYSVDQVREKLAKQEINYDDMIWQKGFEKWTKIGTLEAFDRRRPQTFEKQPKPHFSNQMANNTVVFSAAPGGETITQPMSPAPMEEPPYEVTIPEITRPEITKPEITKTVDPAEMEKTKPEIKAEPAASTVSESQIKASQEAEPPRRRSSSFLIAGAGALVAILFAYVGLNTYKQTLLQKFPIMEKIDATIHGGASAKPQSAPAAGTKTAPKAAPELKIVSLRSATPAKPQILFETNLPAGTSINVDITGEPGKVLGYPRLAMKKEVRVVAGQMPTLDFSAEDLPPGEYRVLAMANGLSNQAEVKVGVQDAELVKKMEAYRGKLIVQEKKERTQLVKSSQWVAKENGAIQKIMKDKNKKALAKNSSVWKKNYLKKVSSLLAMEKSNPKTFVYPQAYSKLFAAARALPAKAGGRSPAAAEDFNRKYQELQGELKNLNFSIKK